MPDSPAQHAAEPDQTDPVPDSGTEGVGLVRSALGAAGVLVGIYGAWLLLSRQDLGQLFSAAIWLGGGVIAHDGLIAIASLVAVAAGALVLPAAARTPAAVGLVVLGSLTLIAIPVLGSWSDEDNDTLLNRDYWINYAGIVAVALVAVAVAALVRARRGADTDDVPVPGAGAGEDADVDQDADQDADVGGDQR